MKKPIPSGPRKSTKVNVPPDQQDQAFYDDISRRASKLRKKSYVSREEEKENIEGLKTEVNFDDHMIPLKELYQRYSTDPEKGLTEEYARQVLQNEGLNMLTPSKTTPQIIVFCYHMFSGFAIVLWGGAALCSVAFLIEYLSDDEVKFDHLYLGVIMLIVVVVSGIFSYVQDRSSSKIMDSFKKMVTHQATVIREGKVKNIPTENLVRGDIVLVKFGSKVPADIRIIESFGMKVDNSSLTGETEPQPRSSEKTHNNPMETQNLAFFSTSVMEGTCKGVVFQVGDKTVIGRLAKLTVGLKRDTSPLKKEIQRFVRIITIVAVCFAAVFFFAAIVTGFTIIQCFIYFLAILIANVPEGLLVTVTLCLTLTAKKMAKKNCLIKCLDSVETLGSTSTICSDKTGTLTQNRMTVVELIYNFKDYEIRYGSDRSSTVDNSFDVTSPDFQNLMRCAQLCLRAEFESTEEDVPVLNRSVEGDASEAAILKCAECILHTVAEFRKRNVKLFEVPFNSTNKYQLSIHKLEDKRHLLVMKGAPEKILELCSSVSIHGQTEPLTNARRAEIEKILLTLGRKGERVLGFCDLILTETSAEYSVEKKNFPTTNLRFLGLMALIDPPRETVPDAVRKCKTAGIRVIMVTGDHPVTAEAIARKVGIISTDTRKDLATRMGIPEDKVPKSHVKAIVVPGDQLRLMSKDQLDDVLLNHSEIVFARTTPTQKLFIVEGCQRLGFITAVTGDGVNDSPALKKADIGIAMGITGSDVSKQAADMILLDDNFASIVTGVEEGRIIFDNLKVLSLQLSQLCKVI
ncbi:UNVERIFIED_CONTAM: hypothetical protein PYX00_004240 [Menopon gallinae]|uniref:Sodium/potassium-transporting ATPase subunit alpha n=2 Tax=Menopon gallinae TaxID=328185 RepID=A0AAW2I3G9_9NEOP